MSALDPSTAVVLKVKDGYADTAADLLRERYQQVLDYSKMYSMNVPMVEQARLFVSGNYVALLILGQTPDGDVTAEEEAQLARQGGCCLAGHLRQRRQQDQRAVKPPKPSPRVARVAEWHALKPSPRGVRGVE